MTFGTAGVRNSEWLFILLAVFISFPLTVASLHASSDDGIWDGTLEASGMFVSSPCVLMPESQIQEIRLDTISMASLKETGDVTLPVDIHVVLDDCPGGEHNLREIQNIRSGLWLSEQSIVRMILTGVPDTDDARFFRVHGVSGVSLRIEDPSGKLLIPGMTGHSLPLDKGRNDLILKAQLWRNSDLLLPGEWWAVVNIGMEYE